MRKALTADAAAVATVVESDAGTARDAAVDVDLQIFIVTPDKTLTCGHSQGVQGVCQSGWIRVRRAANH